MRLRRKPAETGRRRSGINLERTTTSNYSRYAQQRSEQLENTGRQLDRQQIQARAKKVGGFWLQRFGLAILLIVALICAVATVSLSSDAKIVPVTTSSNQAFLQPVNTYQAAADKLLADSILNRNKITADTDRVSQQLLAHFPELKTATVSLPLLGHRPVIYLEPAQPALILSQGTTSYVIDSTGRALMQLQPNSSIAKAGLPVVTDQGNLTVKLKQIALSSDTVTFVQIIVQQLAAKHFTVTTMSLPPAASELDVHLASQPYFIKFNLENNDPLQQVGTFLATQAHLAGQNITPGQYFDVRVDGRAYYQ